MTLYTADQGRHGYTRSGSKAHRLYRVHPFPKPLTSCTSKPVILTFADDQMPTYAELEEFHPGRAPDNP
jgi:hypothetical protein